MSLQVQEDRSRHDRPLELAAAAIDFNLNAAETAELESHLATCQTCARRAGAMRADARALGRPLTLLPSPRVDAAVHAAIARRRARLQRSWIVAAAALLLLTLLGALAVGAYLRRAQETLPTTVIPTPTAPVAVVSPGPTGSPAVLVPSEPPVVATGLIAFVLGPTDAPTLHVMERDGSADRTCGTGSVPSWSADGRTLVFAGPETTTADGIAFSDIYRAAADCTGVTRVIKEGTAPHVSPDGAWITFGRGVNDTGDAWIAKADGSGPRKLMAGTSPTWSPDGAWLLLNPNNGAFELGLIRPDGTAYHSLGGGSDPSWTPDGRIVYVRSDYPKATVTLRVIGLDGTASDLFTAPAGIESPRMLADRRVIFVWNGDVWRLDPGSKEPSQLTHGLAIGLERDAIGPIARLNHVTGPSPSADEKWAAVAVGGGATSPGLVVLSIDGGSTRVLDGFVSAVAWQPVESVQ